MVSCTNHTFQAAQKATEEFWSFEEILQKTTTTTTTTNVPHLSEQTFKHSSAAFKLVVVSVQCIVKIRLLADAERTIGMALPLRITKSIRRA